MAINLIYISLTNSTSNYYNSLASPSQNGALIIYLARMHKNSLLDPPSINKISAGVFT